MTASPKHEVTVHDKLYVNGEWVEPAGKEVLNVINSTTEEVMGRIPEGTAEDINRAVAAARAAFNSWSGASPQKRAGFLSKMSAGLGARQNEIAAVIASEVGMPLPLATAVQAGMPAMVMGVFANLLGEFS